MIAGAASERVFSMAGNDYDLTGEYSSLKTVVSPLQDRLSNV